MDAVLFLHGIGPKPDADQLREQWLASLPSLREAAEAERLPVGMIHWADIEAGGSPSREDFEWVGGHLVGRAFRELDGQQGLGHDDSGGRDLPRGSADIVIDAIARYFRVDAAFRNAVRARVREAIQHVAEHVDRILLVSHDLGAVVAYEVLTHRRFMPGGGEFVDIGDELRSKLHLVTLGSPLGWIYDAELSHYVRRSSKTFPRGLRRWLNVFDEKDPMTAPPFMADPTLSDEYTTFEHNPVDVGVENATSARNSVYAYLDSEAVQRELEEFAGLASGAGKTA